MSKLVQTLDVACSVSPSHPLSVLTWLHVSDLHFGHGREARYRVDQKIVCNEILWDAQKMTGQIGPPDLVFVTGDIAFRGDPQVEYPQAMEWLEKLLNAVKVTRGQLYVVPGNHDVDRAKALRGYSSKTIHESLRANPQDLDELLDSPDEMARIWPKLEAYAEFAEPYAAPKLTSRAPFWTAELKLPLGQVVIVGLNTTLLSFDDKDGMSNLALGIKQLQQAIYDQARGALLLVLQHHPPNWLIDRSKLENMLQDRPHILFCGHVHQQGGLLGFPLHGHGLVQMVAGAGHADPAYLAEHAYAWGQLGPEGLAYFPRIWVEQQHCFMPDRNSFSDMGQDGAARLTRDHLPQALRAWLPTQSLRLTAPAYPVSPEPDVLVGEAPTQSLWLTAQAYLERVRRENERILFPGLNREFALTAHLRSIRVSVEAEAEETPLTKAKVGRAEELWLGLPDPAIKAEEGLARGEIVLWDNLASTTSSWLVIGPAGSGKTTLLQWEAYRHAVSILQHPEVWREQRTGLLPIKLSALDLWSGMSSGKTVLRILQEAAALTLSIGADTSNGAQRHDLDELIASLWNEGRCLILLDEFDMLPADQERRQLLQMFQHVRGTQFQPFIMTSRPLPPGVLTLGTVRTIHLARFHPTRDLSQFVQKWFVGVPAGEDKARRLLQEFKRNPRTADFARNPLMLAFMCLGAEYGESLVPTRRVDLYERVLMGLLETWPNLQARRRRFSIGKRHALRHLAWEDMYHLGGLTEENIVPLLLTIGRTFDWRYDDVCDLLLELTEVDGLLRLRHTGLQRVYSFFHPTFAEYLVAWAATEDPVRFETILNEISDPKRRGVLPLLSALTPEPSAILARIWQADKLDLDTRVRLITECLAECGKQVPMQSFLQYAYAAQKEAPLPWTRLVAAEIVRMGLERVSSEDTAAADILAVLNELREKTIVPDPKSARPPADRAPGEMDRAINALSPNFS